MRRFCLLLLLAISCVHAQTEHPFGGLQGYISADIPRPPAQFGYGMSYYTSIWPLLANPLANFQMGMPSTWMIPNNSNFQQALCPPGTLARDKWAAERGPYFREVFQTIEGGVGIWQSTKFPSNTPKYRINGTPNCYNNLMSSPGWEFGKSYSSPHPGIAQISNRILMPPDGFTFVPQTTADVVGIAWFALPIATNLYAGDQSWTLFLNTLNYNGPVAFIIPNAWTHLAISYPTDINRGLDVQPAQMIGGAMEINTVPYFEAQGNDGVTYSKIPTLNFPVNGNGQTILLQNINFYSANAIYRQLKVILNSNMFVVIPINLGASWAPSCSANPIKLTQTKQNISVAGLENTVQTFSSSVGGRCVFGLQWAKTGGWTQFPMYYKQSGGGRMAIDASQVPDETHLKEATFTPAKKGMPYTISNQQQWSKFASPIYRVKLSDGSTLQYRWYRFVDQPSLQAIELTPAQRAKLQATAVRLQQMWARQNVFMPPPLTGTLGALDPALIVTPPQGMEFGYVPIVVGQE